MRLWRSWGGDPGEEFDASVDVGVAVRRRRAQPEDGVTARHGREDTHIDVDVLVHERTPGTGRDPLVGDPHTDDRRVAAGDPVPARTQPRCESPGGGTD